MPLSDVHAGGLAADAVLPWVDTLCEELAGRPVGDRVHVMGVRLLERLVGTDRAAGPDDAFRTLGRIRAGVGTVPVSTPAREARLSPRRLREMMRRAPGVTPEFASRVARRPPSPWPTAFRSGDGVTPDSIGGSPVLIMLTVPDPDATATQMVRHGGELVIPVENRPYGRRQGRVRDPFGHLWVLGGEPR
ncbi:VOC family protein [Nocardia farcinica]|uniref:VOC family protein n=1 Tax=Nocardia farcinica TaxID=37329 RepID=UPI001E497279|nr:VOC family protein [Nocardia farcinica]